MILVRVFGIVSEDDIRRDGFLELFENILYFPAGKRHESVAKGLYDGASEPRSLDKQGSCVACLCLPNSCSAEYDPVKHGAGILFGKSKDRAATADLNIVGMGAETKNLQLSVRGPIEAQRDHRSADIFSERAGPDEFEDGLPT